MTSLPPDSLTANRCTVEISGNGGYHLVLSDRNGIALYYPLTKILAEKISQDLETAAHHLGLFEGLRGVWLPVKDEA